AAGKGLRGGLVREVGMASIARWCYQHKSLVVVLWVAALAALGGASRLAGSGYDNAFTLPGTESAHAQDLLKSAFPRQAGEADTIVWHVSRGLVRDPAVREGRAGMLGQVARSPSVAGVASPYTHRGAAQVSRDGRTAYATVRFTGIGREIPAGDVKHVIGLAQDARARGLQVELGGQAIQASE